MFFFSVLFYRYVSIGVMFRSYFLCFVVPSPFLTVGCGLQYHCCLYVRTYRPVRPGRTYEK